MEIPGVWGEQLSKTSDELVKPSFVMSQSGAHLLLEIPGCGMERAARAHPVVTQQIPVPFADLSGYIDDVES
jgi:hypothetical protein